MASNGRLPTPEAASIVRPICTPPATKLNPANTPIFRTLEYTFCR